MSICIHYTPFLPESKIIFPSEQKRADKIGAKRRARGQQRRIAVNRLFLVVFLLAAGLLLWRDPSAFLPALLRGAGNAVALCISLAAVYAIWLGFLQVARDAGLLAGMARGMRPLTARLFCTREPKALERIAVNLSANFLGMGGAATPAGREAMRLLGASERAEYARSMLFVVNCSGLQFLPTTVLSLRAQAGAANAYDIILPALLAALCALLIGAGLTALAYRRRA